MNGTTYYEQWFIYTTDWCTALTAAGAAVTVPILITTEALFKCYYVTLTVKQGDAGAEVLVQNWAGDVQLNDAQVGKDLSNIPVAADAIGGIGRDVYNVPPPRIFNKGTTVQVTFTSNVATRTQCKLALHGALMYARTM